MSYSDNEQEQEQDYDISSDNEFGDENNQNIFDIIYNMKKHLQKYSSDHNLNMLENLKINDLENFVGLFRE